VAAGAAGGRERMTDESLSGAPTAELFEEAAYTMTAIDEWIAAGKLDPDLFTFAFGRRPGDLAYAKLEVIRQMSIPYANIKRNLPGASGQDIENALQRVFDGIPICVPELEVNTRTNFPLGVVARGEFAGPPLFYPLRVPEPVSVLMMGKPQLQQEFIRLVVRGAAMANTRGSKEPRVRISVFATYDERMAWKKEFAGLKEFGDPVFDDVPETNVDWRDEAQMLGQFLTPMEHDSAHHIVVIENTEHLFEEAGIWNQEVRNLLAGLLTQKDPRVHVIATVGFTAQQTADLQWLWRFYGDTRGQLNKFVPPELAEATQHLPPHQLIYSIEEAPLWVPKVK